MHKYSAPMASPITPTEKYNELVSTGLLRDDPHQKGVVKYLQALHDELRSFNPPHHSEAHANPKSLFSRLFSTSASSAATATVSPKGLYLYGDVGTGKSMLMDLFYDTLPPKSAINDDKAGGAGDKDPIPGVARDLARNAAVLCFDEFQVTDIVDAMILRRLLESLMEAGVVFVMTSNRHPDDLYKNGIQRSSFIPCIDLLKERFHVVDLDSPTGGFYFVAHRTVGPHRMLLDYRKIPRALSKHLGPPVAHPESAGRVARFSFLDLCGKPLSAADYIEVTREFETIFVTDVPSMNLGQKDMARRFITFIDACYESKTKLFISSEVPITQIFSGDSDNGASISDHQRSVMDDLGLNAESIGKSAIFTGEEEVFAFARACSRLVQMGTREWAEAARG
ncbi:AFG1-like ATPase [Rhizoctonia solani]|uniref:AFG1-like ATPase n=1 Tax=Rhizoctonia solani TaxID=456999 RepID=A0A8H7IIS8_9AGAM|nr:AFG1-like ATPase [Rhizoctonia solani]